MLNFLCYENYLEDSQLKKQIALMVAGILSGILLTACGQDTAVTKFKNEIDDFCTRISEIDSSINNIDATADNAPTKLLGYLQELDTEFQEFSEIDFPQEYDYLESLADEASAYMTEAVESYNTAYSDSYNETMGEYAKENYSRAYKRIQIMITFLHGEEPENVNLSVNN